MTRPLIGFLLFALFSWALFAQEKSVKPGINDPFKNPDVKDFQGKFEGESREVFAKRDKLVGLCKLKPGMVVADVGAGTGLFTRLFAKEVGAGGQVYAVDIAAKFLEHIQKTSREAGLRNVTPVLCNPDSVDLPADSVDLAFVCDTYHHFEFPERTLLSLHRAIKPGGKLVVVDFARIPGKSSDWVLNHVRAGQEVVEKEIIAAGFDRSEEVKDLLKENYLVVFTKPTKADAPPAKAPAKETKSVTPLVPGYGAVVPLPTAAEPPTKGSKVVFDVTATGKEPDKPLPGLERAALLLNLAGAAGLKPTDLEIVVVLHGDATSTALDDAAYKELTGRPHPSADLLKKLKEVGVKVLVCGQSLARKGYDSGRVRGDVSVAASAVSAVVNLQTRGFAYVPAH
ncbi:MAG: methyltransferase domain-containing protein [Planctomycetes bacterium]|nr:methyltransferase domain-containing protein [Planctomycetota bacterium]